MVHEPVNCHGDKHTAYSSDDRQHGIPDVGKLADENLTLDFESYGKEKYRHHRIVDESHDGHRLAMMTEQIEVSNLQYHLV